jgi:hypothetical protein
VACGKTYQVDEGEFAGTVAKMPEFETIFALGTLTGILHGASLIKLVILRRCQACRTTVQVQANVE